MVYKFLRDYSFSIPITLNFIKPYGNIMNLYVIILYKKTILFNHFQFLSWIICYPVAQLCEQLSMNYININV